MKSNCVIQAAGAFFLSLSLGAHARPEIDNVDPENYVPMEVSEEVAKGGIRRLHDLGLLKFKKEDDSQKPRKGNLRALQSMFDDDILYGGNQPVGADGFDDDSIVTEEILTMDVYQDNRFSSPDPIFADAAAPLLEAAGNKWLYANVPLQPLFGINDLPIQGLAQGFCESTDAGGNGLCHFTYEFFELTNGAIVVYASIVASGTISPQGLTTLNILAGTGEFSGAVGEVYLVPVGIDESIVPARVFSDGSFFLGNMNGYKVRFEIALRYLLNAPLPIAPPVDAPIPANPIPATVVTASASAFPTRVLCPGQIESEYCDCDLDCGAGPRCECGEAQQCCARR